MAIWLDTQLESHKWLKRAIMTLIFRFDLIKPNICKEFLFWILILKKSLCIFELAWLCKAISYLDNIQSSLYTPPLLSAGQDSHTLGTPGKGWRCCSLYRSSSGTRSSGGGISLIVQYKIWRNKKFNKLSLKEKFMVYMQTLTYIGL